MTRPSSPRLRRAPGRAAASLLVLLALVAAVACSRPGSSTSGPTSTPASAATSVAGAAGTAGTSTPGTSAAGGAAPTAWSANPPVAPKGAAVEHTLTTADGRERTYRVYVPSSLPTDRPVPLLVAMHGGLGSSAQFEENSGFDGIAEANGFIVVYPDGIGSAVKDDFARTWNGGDCCGPAVKQAVDDVAFIRQLVSQLQQEHQIDPARIYAAGHSNGGIMSYRLACEASDLFAGIGLQAGTLSIDTCTPSHPVSLLHVHGTADENLPIDGGAGKGVAGVSFRPPIDGIRTLARVDGCPSTPTTTTDPDNADVTIDTWSPCSQGTEVQLVKVAGASHAFMGGPQRPAQRAVVGEAYDRYSSAQEIWEFLAAHPRA